MRFVEPAAGARRLTAGRARLILLLLAAVGGLVVLVADVGSGRTLLLSPADRRADALHGTWHRMFDWGLADRAPVLVWVVALLAVGLIGLPYLWLAAASLPDRGFALARPVGLLLIGWLVWLLVSCGLVDFSRRAIALSMVIAAVVGGALVASRRREFLEWLSSNRRLVLVEEALFWSLFTTALLVRWANPDLWHPSRGGEKPMDLAFLNAVTKSAHFPPYDPWFAGGQMNYYYFGFVLVAVLVKLTGVVSYVAYNLAVPTFFAFLGTAGFGATIALADTSKRRTRPIAAGLLGTLFVAVVGNLGELRVLALRAGGSIPNDWWYWNPSRVIHHPATEPGPINEFPSFTYLFADLHAHAMALPYTVVLLALAVTLIRPRPAAATLTAVVHFLLLALVLGALWPLNTWDVPTYALIAGLALLAGWYLRPRAGRLLGLPDLALRGALLVLVAYVLFLPFHRHYSGVFAGVERWQGSRTRLNDYLTIHGLFLFVITTAVLADLATSADIASVPRTYRAALRRWDRYGRFRELRRLLVRGSVAYRTGCRLVPAACVLTVVLAAVGEGVSALATGLGTLALLALVRRRRTAGRLGQTLWVAILALFLIGLAITVGVEFLVAKNIDVGRNNTVFKFYLQVWVLWAITSAVALQRLYECLPRFPAVVRHGWRFAFVALLAAACLYPFLATRARIADRFDTSVGPSLNGLAFTKKAVLEDHGAVIRLADDAAAIRWLMESLPGSPVVAEINTYPTLYGWGERFAMFTGNPTIVGWDYHERQQRPPQSALVMERIADVQTAYGTTDPDRAYRIFRRYGVAYFVVGALERAYFPAGQDKWSLGEGTRWRTVYQNSGVRIYKLE